MALRLRPAIQRIDLGPGDRLFDAGDVIVKQFLGLRAGDVRSSAIDRRHGNLRGHQRAHGSGGVFVFGDGHGWLLAMESAVVSNSRNALPFRPGETKATSCTLSESRLGKWSLIPTQLTREARQRIA